MKERFQRVLKSHNAGSLLSINNEQYRQEILQHTVFELYNDLGGYSNGDLTSQLLFPRPQKIEAKIIAKRPGILAGTEEMRFFLAGKWENNGTKVFDTIRLTILQKDGTKIQSGVVLAKLHGSITDILKVERTILNLLQRMSGVATLTRKFTKKTPPSVLITPTRKTLWGLLDKKACVTGGGGTHRLGLYDGILVKDTHLNCYKHNLQKLFWVLIQNFEGLSARFVEIEIENINDGIELAKHYQQYLQKGGCLMPFYLLLDNMQPAAIQEFVRLLKNKRYFNQILLEASGGITLKNIGLYAKSGVDIISVGALTHSAPSLDMALNLGENYVFPHDGACAPPPFPS